MCKVKQKSYHLLLLGLLCMLSAVAKGQTNIANPALLHLMIDNDRYFFIKASENLMGQGTIFTAFDYSRGKQEGDYLPYQGKDFRDFSFRAHGYSKKEKSTFLGKASFSTGIQKQYDWNAVRHAELYWPYIVADSTGGDYHYETYTVMGAYSFELRKVNVGVSAEYKGDFAYRQNDPRAENITTWLTLNAGAAYRVGGNIYSAGIEYMLHRQHVDLHHFRTGQFAGFFIEYGFGMFDYVHSPIFRSMKRQQHLNDWGVNLAFHSDPNRPLRISAQLKYTHDLMTTEENIYKLNLYRATTHKWGMTCSMLWDNAVWGIGWSADLNTAKKDGQENIFERYVSAVIDGVDVYDYNKIGEHHRYHLQTTNGQTDLKLSCFLPHSTLSVLGGVTCFMRNETYDEYDYQIKNTLLTPLVGMELAHRPSNYDILIRGTWGHRMSLNNTYRVGIDLERHTEFQHAFTPYAYYAHHADIITIEATVARTFAFGKIGINAQLMYQKGRRLSDVSYDPERYAAANPYINRPTISCDPDIHNASYGKVTLFTVF